MKLRKETTRKVRSERGEGGTKEWCASRARPVGTGIIIAGGAVCSRLHGDFDDSAYVKLGVGNEKEREIESEREQIAFKTIKASNIHLRFSDVFIFFYSALQNEDVITVFRKLASSDDSCEDNAAR